MAAGHDEDPAWHLLFLIAILAVLVWLVWRFFGNEMMQFVRYVRLAEMYIISLFDSDARACLKWLRIAPVGNNVPTTNVYAAAIECYGAEGLRRLPPAEALKYYNVSPSSLSYVTTITKQYIRWIAVLICGGLGIYMMYFSPRNKFRTRHTLESLIKIQSKMWPVITPIVKFNPSKHSARAPGETITDKLPLFAEALSPEEWISYHRIPVVNGIPEREMVRRALLLQLGPRWSGIKNLPPYVLALFAAFALMGVQKRNESEELLGKLALCWTPESGFRITHEVAAEVKKIANDPNIGGEALKVANRYAYRTTAMLGVLRWARAMGGVLAPAYFLWLRGVDRALWYPLNNLGRRSFHTEGAGALAHYMAEEAAGKPLPIPRIDTAIVTINQYLAGRNVQIPPREESKAV